MSEEVIVDVRGETCPAPAQRVERLLKEKADRRPFLVIGDHRPILEALPLLAERYGWRVEFEQAPDGSWHVRFRPRAPGSEWDPTTRGARSRRRP